MASPIVSSGATQPSDLLHITVTPYLGTHAFPKGSGVGYSPEIGSVFTTPVTDTTHFVFGIGFSQGFKDQSLHSITTTEWGLQFDTPFKLISPYASSYTTVLLTRDSLSRVSQLSFGFGLRFFMKRAGNMILRTDARFGAGNIYRTGFERVAVTKRPDWINPPKLSPKPKEEVQQDIYYRVIVDSLNSQDAANTLSKELVSKGYKTYLWRDKDTGLYNVQVFFVKEIEKAETYKDQLIKEGYSNTYLRKKG
jgi:hypothetical protein